MTDIGMCSDVVVDVIVVVCAGGGGSMMWNIVVQHYVDV